MRRKLRFFLALSVILIAAWVVSKQPLRTDIGQKIEEFTSGSLSAIPNPVEYILDQSGIAWRAEDNDGPVSFDFWNHSDDFSEMDSFIEEGQTIHESISDLASDPYACDAPSIDLSEIPEWSGMSYYVINSNIPFFSDEEKQVTSEFLILSDLDDLGRCGSNHMSVCPASMPDEDREGIGQVKPSGWHTSRYDDMINGKYLYNRCHLLGFQLSGLNADERNLITGTRYLNVDGQLPFENAVASYVRETRNHVLYRVTPIYDGSELVARGVLEEGYSVEDGGAGICFCVFCYNIQPGIIIDYSSGENWESDGAEEEMEIARENGATSVVGNVDPFYS